MYVKTDKNCPCLYVKVICRRFTLLLLLVYANAYLRYVDFLKTYENNRICLKVAYFCEKSKF